jgi:riboflavin synthase
MFTGIVEELGEVTSIEHGETSARLTVRGPTVVSDASLGDSVSVNGVCLTVVARESDSFAADVMKETLDRSSLGTLTTGSKVNLERPLTLSARLGGHLVQGHVDASAAVLRRTPGEHWELVEIALPSDVARYVVTKGSITVDGVSLTVSTVNPGSFVVSLIPATLAATTLGMKQPGELVNLEVDVIAKYVERMMQGDAS